MRRYSFDDGLRLRCDSLNALRQFGSLEFVPAANNSKTLRVSASYNRARVSELTDEDDDDKVEEPVFVDIPTLVAVLIKPDTSVQVDTHQIEEISSDSALEDTVDTEFNRDIEHHFANLVDVPVENDSNDSIKSLPVLKENEQPLLDTRYPNLQILSDKSLSDDDKFQKQYPVSSNFEVQVSLEKSISNTAENVPQDSGVLRISTIDSEAQADSEVEESKKIIRIEDDNLNDSLKEDNEIINKILENRKELQNQKLCLQRHQNTDGLKRKSSKDSSSNSSKDEQIFISGISRDSFGRKDSIDPEQPQPRPHTIIQRARRAEIVAAVTERLYSSKKTTEDSNTASTPASDIRSPESTEVKLASVTRMRLQEISRKMLAKRRRICVDTQTDISSTVRVREIGISVKEPKIVRKDVAVLTDRHEDFDKLLPCSTPVLRIKEMSTSTTESPVPKPIILLKDASNLTDYYSYDYDAIDSLQPDSGIVSDDTHTYAESNLSSTGISDFCSDLEKRPVDVKLSDSSANTNIVEEIIDSCAQTTYEHSHHYDVPNDKCCTSKQCGDNSIKQVSGKKTADCCRPISVTPRPCKPPVVTARHCHSTETVADTHKCAQESSCKSSCCKEDHDKNIISISVPDTINITIESSNISESKVRLFDHNKVLKLNNVEVQTDRRDSNEIGTLTDINISGISVKDSWTNARNSHDTKTFRIENIFKDPHDIAKSSKSYDYSDGTNYSIIYPKTTQFTETKTENDAYDSCRATLSSLESRRKSLTSEWLRNRNTWSSQKCHRSFDNENNTETNSLPPENYYDSIVIKQSKKNPEILSWKDVCEDKKSLNGLTVSECLKSNDNTCYLKKIGPNYRDIYEKEVNFSDDSLDSKERQRNLIDDEITGSEMNIRIKDNFNDNGCPPDIVVHAKKDIIDPLAFSDNNTLDDFDDKYIELPKKIGIRLNEIPRQKIKSIFYSVPLIPLVLAENGIEQSEGSTKNLKATASPKSIIKNNISVPNMSRSVNTSTNESRPESDYKKVSFVESDNFSINSEDVKYKTTRIRNSFEEEKRNLLEEYLEEAIVFMRNINSINSDEKSGTLTFRRENNVETKIYEPKNKRVVDHRYTTDDLDLKGCRYDEKCCGNSEKLDRLLKFDKSAETKSHLAKFSSDNVNSSNSRSSCSRLRSFSSVDDLNWDHKLKNNVYSRSDCNSKFSQVIEDDKYFYQLPSAGANKVYTNIDSARAVNTDFESYSQGRVRSSAPKIKKRSRSELSIRPKTGDCSFSKKVVTFDENNLHTHKKLMNNESALIAKGRKSLANPRCSLSKYDSSNENSSSNEALANFMESIDEASRFRDKIKFPCSPRLKFLQLLSERRKIVKDSRNTSIS